MSDKTPCDKFRTFQPDDSAIPPILPLKKTEKLLLKAISEGSLSGIALYLETQPGLGHLQSQWFLTKDQAQWLLKNLRNAMRDI